ncbi:MAG: PilZ domain-containing protein [Endomicrobia bacterium]|nr:PilZ domain-containing protein [Endomicrobiia bacterium]
MVEKRKNRRMPIIKQFGEPVMVHMEGKSVPGVILDLSTDGVSIISYAYISVASEVCITIDLPTLKTKPMIGKVVWTMPKGDMWRMGIYIEIMDTLDAKHINRMAIDFNDCENKISLGAPDVCAERCSYHQICEKPQKTAGDKE